MRVGGRGESGGKGGECEAGVRLGRRWVRVGFVFGRGAFESARVWCYG